MQSLDGYALIDPVSRNDTRNLELNIINPPFPSHLAYVHTYVRTRIFFPLENSPFSLPFRLSTCSTCTRARGGKDERGRDGGKKERRGGGGEEGAWANARYWCIKRAYLRSLFSRMWTPGMHRSREEGNRAPDCITSAIYLFYPGGWIKLVYGVRTRACCVYARRKPRFAQSADLPA